MAFSPLFQTVVGGLGVSVGAMLLFAPARFRRDTIAKTDRALAERDERGEDAWFEERRTLEAYRKPPSLRTLRIFGALLVLSCGALLFHGLTRAGT